MAVLDPLLAAIKTAIEGASIAVEGVNLFWDRMPDLPVEVICFTRYSGRPGERIAELTGIAYDYPRVQLSVRGVDPEVVYNKAQAAYVAVSQYRGTAIQVFTPQSAVGLVMYDETISRTTGQTSRHSGETRLWQQQHCSRKEPNSE